MITPSQQKDFDFTTERFSKHCKAKQDFLRDNHDKPITLEQYMKLMRNVPKHGRWSKGHSPSRLTHEYNRLVQVYGFFPGGQL